MRTKKEILAEVAGELGISGSRTFYELALLEVLIDIRDVLKPDELMVVDFSKAKFTEIKEDSLEKSVAIDNAVTKIEALMMYRGCMSEEGQLREILEMMVIDSSKEGNSEGTK